MSHYWPCDRVFHIASFTWWHFWGGEENMAQSQGTFPRTESYVSPLIGLELGCSPLSPALFLLNPANGLWGRVRNYRMRDQENTKWGTWLYSPSSTRWLLFKDFDFLLVCVYVYARACTLDSFALQTTLLLSHLTKEKAKMGRITIICHKRGFLSLGPSCVTLC